MYVNSLGNLLEVLKIFMQNLRDCSLVIVPLHAFDAKTLEYRSIFCYCRRINGNSLKV